MAYHRYHGVDTKIVRIFNTYGPRMRVNDGRAVPAFMSQALRNEDVTVFGDGSQTRSFTYITDLVDGIIKLMLSTENDPVNIGNPREMTIKEIAETIIRMTGSKSKIVYKPLPTDDPKQRRPDITRARTLLGGSRRCSSKKDWSRRSSTSGPRSNRVEVGRVRLYRAPANRSADLAFAAAATSSRFFGVAVGLQRIDEPPRHRGGFLDRPIEGRPHWLSTAR